MRAVVWSFGAAVLAGSLVALVAASLRPADASLALDLYLLFLGGVTMLALARATRLAQPGSGESPFELALAPTKPRTERPPELERLENQLALAATTAFDVHYRLRHIVRGVAAQRLWARHAVDLEADTEKAEQLLAPEVWELVRPDRPPPTDPFAPGLGVAGIDAVITELERT
jgi:hypothetical protein